MVKSWSLPIVGTCDAEAGTVGLVSNGEFLSFVFPKTVGNWRKTVSQQGSPAAFFISLAGSGFGAPGVRPLGSDSLF